MRVRALWNVTWAGLAVLSTVSCGQDQGVGPSAAVEATSARDAGARASNNRPSLVLRTTPAADDKAVPYPRISGVVPLTVRFNLCRSGDPDMVILPDGTPDPRFDSINWQFHFGDTSFPAFNPDGTFRPDFDHFCRVDHTYTREGTYTATLSVSDKHREDDLGANARQTIRVTINAFSISAEPPSNPGAAPVILSFEEEDSCGDGGDTEVAWTTSGATSATLNGMPVPVNGSAVASQGTTYTLVVTGPGGTATRQLTTVNCS